MPTTTATRLTRAPLSGRRMAVAAFDDFVGLAALAPLDVLVAEELEVVGRGVYRVVKIISNEDDRDTEGSEWPRRHEGARLGKDLPAMTSSW